MGYSLSIAIEQRIDGQHVGIDVRRGGAVDPKSRGGLVIVLKGFGGFSGRLSLRDATGTSAVAPATPTAVMNVRRETTLLFSKPILLKKVWGVETVLVSYNGTSGSGELLEPQVFTRPTWQSRSRSCS
jgi:hypothetical protein